MKLSCTRSKNSATYYVQKTYRVGKKTTTKTIERLGTYEDLKARAGDQDPIEWAHEYVAELTRKEKEENAPVLVEFSQTRQLPKDAQQTFNVGYLFLQNIYYRLGMPKIAKKIAERHAFEYDLNAILSRLIYSRILSPSSKLATYSFSKQLLEPADFALHDIYRALEVLAKENDFIQAQLYKNSQKVISRKKTVLYYDCTNYYFEIEEEDDFRRYGISKEHRPNPIVQMGLFMDEDGIPLSFSLFPGNENEQPSLKPLEQKILKDFGLNQFVVCTDAGLASAANRRFNDRGNRGFVTTQPLKKMKSYLQDFCLSKDGWHREGSRRTYNLDQLDEEKDKNKVFYKERWILENGIEQRLIVTFSLKARNYQRWVRYRQVNRAQKIIDSGKGNPAPRQNDPKRFIDQEFCTDDGEKASRELLSLDQERIDHEARFDGFYAVCTNLEDDVSSILAINRNRWEIEECFRIMKSEFKARPVYLSREDRITAHFLTCFLALVIFRILQQQLGGKYSCEEIIDTLRSMTVLEISGEGYVPAYTRVEITDALHQAFGFRTDYQIITRRNMRKICSATKK